jgi:hypothetical protein
MLAHLPSDVTLKIEQAVRLVREDKFQDAYYIVSEIEEDHYDVIEQFEELRRLRRDVRELENSLDLLHDIDSWSLVTNEDNIATFSRGSGSEFFVRGEMTMNQPVFPVMALFSEIDLIPQW